MREVLGPLATALFLCASCTHKVATETSTATSTEASPVDASISASASASASASPPDMLLVPAGSFTMGRDTGGEADEHPAHVVTLAAFYLDKTPVTNAKYLECVAAKKCRRYESTLACAASRLYWSLFFILGLS